MFHGLVDAESQNPRLKESESSVNNRGETMKMLKSCKSGHQAIVTLG